MAREIKFRAKNTKNEWVCGHYAELATQGDYLTPSIIDNGFVNVVNPETLCQYTGLTDKNGKEIYEGDVIDDSYISPLSGEKIEKKYVIEFEDGCFWAKMIPSHPHGSTYLDFKHKKSVVIGNIHENPELI